MITANESNARQYVKLVKICQLVDGEVKLFKDGTTQQWYVTARGRTYCGSTIDAALNQAAIEILGE
ncbi:hypothetical protein HYP85_gp005 [Pseudomonas phage Zuri]|uniref:mRNA endoribonuclease n=1 Tax=Pseudomonas phage Zuri TaxID=2604899 RepID=A0A5C1K5T9_9CAUD|nr:hypothetical protein HYP85_gp005 [Pseudomonas phage Zuri]QEM41102.1 mRNA endoribonuclease [Pseudomonas phage Zuri]